MQIAIQTKDAVEGIVKRNPKGFCFVNVIQDEKEFDVFIPPEFCKTSYTGDVVKILYSTLEDGRLQGQIIETISENRVFYGVVKIIDGVKYVISDNDQFIIKDQEYAENSILKIRIKPKFQSYKTFWSAEVEKDFGKIDSEYVYQRVALDKYDIQQSFNKMCKKEVQALTEQSLNTINTVDLTHIPFVTIDSESTKDIDDAIFVDFKSDSVSIYVAIANVASHVYAGSALDKTAKERVSTLYLPGLTVPMLPRELSENKLSLIAGEERLAIVGQFDYAKGKLINVKFKSAKIKVADRMSYNQVDQLLVKESYWENVYKFILSIRQDSLFNRVNYSLDINDQGFMSGLIEDKTTPSQQIVETCMLLYNQKVAEQLYIPMFAEKQLFMGIFRVQDKPTEEKLLKLNQLFSAWGIDIDVSQFTYDEVKQILHDHQESEHFDLINSSIIRALPRSEYDYYGASHFSLNYERYAHATSPIRRYVDLVNQRKLLSQITGMTEMFYSPDHEMLVHIADVLQKQHQVVSYTEAKLKIDFLSKQVEKYANSQLKVKVTNVTLRGIIVEVADAQFQVFIPMRDLLKAEYKFDSQKMCYQKTEHAVKIGSELTVALTNLNHFSYPILTL